MSNTLHDIITEFIPSIDGSIQKIEKEIEAITTQSTSNKIELIHSRLKIVIQAIENIYKVPSTYLSFHKKSNIKETIEKYYITNQKEAINILTNIVEKNISNKDSNIYKFFTKEPFTFDIHSFNKFWSPIKEDVKPIENKKVTPTKPLLTKKEQEEQMKKDEEERVKKEEIDKISATEKEKKDKTPYITLPSLIELFQATKDETTKNDFNNNLHVLISNIFIIFNTLNAQTSVKTSFLQSSAPFKGDKNKEEYTNIIKCILLNNQIDPSLAGYEDLKKKGFSNINFSNIFLYKIWILILLKFILNQPNIDKTIPNIKTIPYIKVNSTNLVNKPITNMADILVIILEDIDEQDKKLNISEKSTTIGGSNLCLLTKKNNKKLLHGIKRSFSLKKKSKHYITKKNKKR